MTTRGQRRSTAAAGFTLIEVMLALAVLAMALTMLLRTASSNLAATRNAQMMSVAAELARAKMFDLEEQLLEDGFGELDLELDGEFDDEGWSKITWEAKIVKIELPNLEAMSSFAAGGEGGAEGEGAASNPLMGVLGMLGGGAGDPGAADAASAAAGGLISSQFELFRTILEESIRKITLTVKWKVGNVDRQLVLDLYITNPSAVGRRAAMLGISSGSSRGGSSSGSGSGSGSGSDSTGGTRGGSTRGAGTRGTVR